MEGHVQGKSSCLEQDWISPGDATGLWKESHVPQTRVCTRIRFGTSGPRDCQAVGVVVLVDSGPHVSDGSARSQSLLRRVTPLTVVKVCHSALYTKFIKFRNSVRCQLSLHKDCYRLRQTSRTSPERLSTEDSCPLYVCWKGPFTYFNCGRPRRQEADFL